MALSRHQNYGSTRKETPLNFSPNRSGVGKSGMLENKSSNISETRKDRVEKKLLWTAYRNSLTLFRTVPSPTPYVLPFLEIGGLQLSYPLLSQEQVKLRTSNFGDIFTWPFQIKAL